MQFVRSYLRRLQAAFLAAAALFLAFLRLFLSALRYLLSLNHALTQKTGLIALSNMPLQNDLLPKMSWVTSGWVFPAIKNGSNKLSVILLLFFKYTIYPPVYSKF